MPTVPVARLSESSPEKEAGKCGIEPQLPFGPFKNRTTATGQLARVSETDEPLESQGSECGMNALS